MDFLDPAQNRAHTIRLFIGYILVAIAIATGSLILLLQAFGYDVDRRTGQVIQNGLVFVDSHPESADIYLNGVSKGKTSTKLAIPAGQYNMELKRDGYHSWKRSFNLEGGSIEQLVYPVLFPTNLVTKDIQLYGSAPTFASASPDRRWLMVQQPDSLVAFDLFDLNNPDVLPKTLSMAPALFTPAAGAHSLSLVEWSTNNSHVLIKHSFATGTEFVVLDREDPAASFNINQVFSLSPTQVALRDKKHDRFYMFDAKTGVLQAADFKTKQSTSLLTQVVAFKAYGPDTLLYVMASAEQPGKQAIKVLEGDKNYLLHYYPTSAEYELDMARFSGHMYAVIAPKSAGQVYIYKDPIDAAKKDTSVAPAPFVVLKMQQTAFVSFSAIARFVVAQSGNRFAIYDVETNRRHYYELKEAMGPEQEATWMDGHRLLVVLQGKTVAFDFDGINQQTLAASQPGFMPFFDRDYLGLYNVAPSAQVTGRFALTRTELKVKQ